MRHSRLTEDRCLLAYPRRLTPVNDNGGAKLVDLNDEKRRIYAQGFRDGIKETELSWRDVARIVKLADTLRHDAEIRNLSEKLFYNDILRRFNHDKKD